MKPPYHPEHVERVQGLPTSSPCTSVRAACGDHWAGAEYRLGQPLPDGRTVARALADDFNDHRLTYV